MADSNARGRNTTTKQTSTKPSPATAQAAARNKSKASTKPAPAFTAAVAAARASAQADGYKGTHKLSQPTNTTSKTKGYVRTTASKSTGTKSTKPVSSSGAVSGGSVGGYDGNAYVAEAQNEFGYNPSLQYNPVDTSSIMDLLGKWDPNSIGSAYDGAYANLDRLRSEGQNDYDQGDAKLNSIYRNLTDSITRSARGVQAGYDTARNNINADATMLSGAAASDAQAIQGNRQQMLKNLGIEAAAPDLVANDNAAAQTGQRVTQAAGVQSNLASLLGANANTFVLNSANSADMQGAEARSGLLSQRNDYMSDLAGKQSDVDSAKAQAVSAGYQNYQDAARNLGLQKMQFDFQNSQNSYNAASQNNQNAMSMFTGYNNQQQAQAQAAQEAYSAKLKADADATSAAQSQSNWEREYALKAQTAAGKSAGATDLYSVMQTNAAKYGFTDTNSFQNAMQAIEGAAASGGLGNNPGEFAARVGKLNKTGLPTYALNALASSYWQTAGAKAGSNIYS